MYYRYLLAGVIPLASVAEVFAEAPNTLNTKIKRKKQK